MPVNVSPFSRENTCTMPVLHVLRVFCDSEGQFGSPLGVVLDGPAILPERRRPLAAELGFSETVYVDDPDTGQLRIFTPAAELPFAGHPLVGTAWLLSGKGAISNIGTATNRRSGQASRAARTIRHRDASLPVGRTLNMLSRNRFTADLMDNRHYP